MGDDGLHHLAPCVPSWLVAITLTSVVTIVVVSIRQVTKQEDGLGTVILHATMMSCQYMWTLPLPFLWC